MELRVSAGFCMAREFARIRVRGPFKTCGKTMLKPLTGARRPIALADLGAVRVQGADAIQFLQGQLSNDMARLTPDMALLAGLHNAQGRTIALLRLARVGPDEIVGILPRELAVAVAGRLAKFVLRAKAKISDASADFAIAGVEAGGLQGWPEATPGAVRREADGSISICAGVSPLRWLALMPVANPASDSDSSAASREHWRRLDIADGTPQVYAATSEAFVAQMLNLDVAGGISFEKGCYTGQEVIARAHYRGKVKRRMQRFVTRASAELAPGTSGTLKDGRSFKVVDAVKGTDGSVEFLAVAPTHASLGDTPAVAQDADSTPDASPPGLVGLEARQLELPYSLPT
jgi:tRNA-modifying protein YgfZ